MIQFTTKQKARLIQWAEWLETTTLKQCKGRLHDGQGYCCLGVYMQCKYSPRWREITMDAKEEGEIFQLKTTEYYGSYIVLDTLVSRTSNIYDLNREDQVLLGLNKNWKHNGHVWKLHRCFQILNDEHAYNFQMSAREIRNLVEHGEFTEPANLLLQASIMLYAKNIKS